MINKIQGGRRGTGCQGKRGGVRAIQKFEPLEKIFEFFVDKCIVPKYHPLEALMSERG
jgi:hypothetical protein